MHHCIRLQRKKVTRSSPSSFKLEGREEFPQIMSLLICDIFAHVAAQMDTYMYECMECTRANMHARMFAHLPMHAKR